MNPFRLLYKIPFVKKRDESLGVNKNEILDNAFENRNYGISIMVSGGVLIAIVFLLQFTLCNIIFNLLDFDFIAHKPIFIGFGIISFLVCHIFVFRNDRYLKYFKKFEEWGESITRKNIIFSVFFTILLIIAFFLSLF